MKLELRRVTLATPGAEHAQRRWPERSSLLLRLTDSAGHSGVGEASPLPGYSPDTLDAAEAALRLVAPGDVARALELGEPWAMLGAVATLASTAVPSAGMALETAALDLLGQRLHVSAPHLLGAAPHATHGLAALLGPASAPTLLAAAKQALQAGFRCCKLKLGAPDRLAAELAGVASLRAELGPDVKLRLDANGSLTNAQLTAAWRALEPLDIELFEEPGPTPESLPRSLPLALDESLQRLDDAQALALLEQSHARYVVLKPMALGGLARCWRLARQARTVGALPIISHCFDGPFAWRAAAALALTLPGEVAHGLAPHAGLAGWRRTALPVLGGALSAWPASGLGERAEHFG